MSNTTLIPGVWGKGGWAGLELTDALCIDQFLLLSCVRCLTRKLQNANSCSKNIVNLVTSRKQCNSTTMHSTTCAYWRVRDRTRYVQDHWAMWFNYLVQAKWFLSSFQELYQHYKGVGERSVGEMAKLVGFELPKQFTEWVPLQWSTPPCGRQTVLSCCILAALSHVRTSSQAQSSLTTG